MKKAIKVISVIFSIIGAIVVVDNCLASIILKKHGKSPVDFYKSAYDFGCSYWD